MKVDSAKAWPYPVLRPRHLGDDYPASEFQVEITCERHKESVVAVASADYVLSDRYLLELVEQDKAAYVLLVRSPKTHVRKLFKASKATKIEAEFTGDIAGLVEFVPFLVSTAKIEEFSTSNWHPDYHGLSFKLEPGSVLAIDDTKEFWVDSLDEAPVGSIIDILEAEHEDGCWDASLQSELLQLHVSRGDYSRLMAARESVRGTPEIQYLINGLYLPMLIHVLHVADQDPEAYQHYRWFASLDARLHAIDAPKLGEPTPNRSHDAQRLFENPFGRIPLMLQADQDI